MKKVLALTLCLIILVSSVTFAVACVNTGDKTIKEYDMSLRSDTLYGLYWYGDSGELDDMKISQENMPVEYYDPDKPTLIYSHGWKTAGEEKETLSTLDKTYNKTNGASGNYNYVKELKELGYNVAFWDWHEYARELNSLQNEIWTVMSPETLEEDNSNYYAAAKALDGRSFAGEFVRSMYAVMKNSSDQDVILVGHSFGGQVVTSVAYTLYKLADEGVIGKNMLPDRISLADPYIPGTAVYGKMDLIEENIDSQPTAQKTADAFEYLNSKGVAIDLNGAMKGWTYDGYMTLTKIADAALREQVDTKIKANTIYIIQKALTSAYGVLGDIHVVSRDYVLTSFIEGKKGNLNNCAPNVSMSAAELRQYIGREFELTGKGFAISDAGMTETSAE